MDNAKRLGQFLRARRAAVDPVSAGIVAHGRRRTPGLRREEVATLSGVSVSWYTWLEQGRPVHPSAEVIDALARCLQLSDFEADHLRSLAGVAPKAIPSVVADGAPFASGAAAILRHLEPVPAYALDGYLYIAAWNRPMAALFPAMAELDERHRNLLWIMFCDEQARSLVADIESESQRMLAQFRARWGHRADPTAEELVERIRERSPRFAELWEAYEVGEHATRIRRFHHPTAGELRFRSARFEETGAPGVALVAHLPIDGDDSLSRLASALDIASAVTLPTD